MNLKITPVVCLVIVAFLSLRALFAQTAAGDAQSRAFNNAGNSAPSNPAANPTPAPTPVPPLSSDPDYNAWAATHFSTAQLKDPATAGPDADPDTDGLSNYDEFMSSTDPWNRDTDGDDIPDGQDAVPTVKTMTVHSAPEANYALIDLGTVYYPRGVNDRGEVLLNLGGEYKLWSNGSMKPVTTITGPNAEAVGPLQDGSVYYPGNSTEEFIWDDQSMYGDYSTVTKTIRVKWSASVTEDAGCFSQYNMSHHSYTGFFNPEGSLDLISGDAATGLNGAFTSANPDALAFTGGGKDFFFAEAYLWGGSSCMNDNSSVMISGYKEEVVSQAVTDGLYIWEEGNIYEWTNLADSKSTVISTSWGASTTTITWVPISNGPEGGEKVGRFLVNNDDFCAYERGGSSQQGVVLTGGNRTDIPGCQKIVDLTTKNTPEGPYILGTKAGGETAMWCYNSGKLVEKVITGSSISASVGNVVVGRRISNQLVIPLGSTLFRNSKTKQIADLCGNPASWSGFSINLVSPNKNILAGSAFKDGQWHSVMLLPVDMRVDANRDGKIDDKDTTSESKPYRFWLNNNCDQLIDGEEQSLDPSANEKDAERSFIACKRDLEDFAPLVISVSGIVEALKSGQILAALKFKQITQSPSIRIVNNVDQTESGVFNYLTDEAKSDAQLVLPFGSPIQTNKGMRTPIDCYNSFILPASFWSDLTESNPKKNLLFEGLSAGKGELVFEFYKSDGTTKIGEGPGVYLDLHDFTDFYEHWTCGDTIEKTATVSATATHPTDNSFEYSANNDGLSMPSADTYNDYVLFVHGWRMQTWERRAYAETAFKRMYHQGYKGKCGFFSWPTEWVDLDSSFITKTKNALSDPQHYDRCEVKARQAGDGPLHGLLVSLNARFGTSHLHVFAHSMGNVVVSEALRAHPATPLINTYIACQSAEVAQCYDKNVALTRVSGGVFIPNLYRENPQSPWEASEFHNGENYHSGLALRAVNKFSNFANLGDKALGSWDLNQFLKPDSSFWPSDTSYWFELQTFLNPTSKYYPKYMEDPPGITGDNQAHQIYWPADRFKVLPHIIPALSRATGATEDIGGEFDSSSQVDIGAGTYQFGSGRYSHSAEFVSNFAKRRSFYHRLLLVFKLDPYPLIAQ